ncbi:Bifunctional lysine-specific demethylase and histidyl-hydroxylase NO66 [Symbiodinium microadriaticum]|uniref:Bifunctional lysine-specific demethylase and histidyl-hydroxylase n=1 Tax=Symbiodinium microadriaticum TaxID=2951 RepID=A0A1Q9CKC1_SYMMI|nr:Bifunctional lysine-specific demethylase and histidyl-hydroxylase NO66 [Symbiodinium microadriaticum]
MASSSEAGRRSALCDSSAALPSNSSFPVDYEEAAAEATEEVQVDAGPADSVAEAYGRVFQWEHDAFHANAPPAVLLPDTSLLRNQSLDDRVMTLVDDLASTMHRVQLLEQELSDRRSFVLELHGSLLDIIDQDVFDAIADLHVRLHVLEKTADNTDLVDPRTLIQEDVNHLRDSLGLMADSQASGTDLGTFAIRLQRHGETWQLQEWGRASQDFEAAKELLNEWKVLQLFRHEEAFVPSKIQGQAAASMAAALMAASVAAGPAQAESPKLSFFGLGGGGSDDSVSDVYNQNDNPVNPYSQFSEVGSESVYKALTAAFERFDKTAFYIKTKQSQQLTSNLQEAAGFKQDMVYFSGAEGSDAYNKARAFSQKISTVGVDGRNKEWGRASQDFEAAKGVAMEDRPSHHLTISTYQRFSWADLLEKALPAALEAAAAQEPRYRRGLPLRCLGELGVQYRPKPGVPANAERQACIKEFRSLLAGLADHAPAAADAAGDFLAAQFVGRRLPPAATHKGPAPSAGVPVEVRWAEPMAVRVVVECSPGREPEVQIYHALENSADKHMTPGVEPSPACIVLEGQQWLPSLQALNTASLGAWISDTALDPELTQGLWEHGLLETRLAETSALRSPTAPRKRKAAGAVVGRPGHRLFLLRRAKRHRQTDSYQGLDVPKLPEAEGLDAPTLREAEAFLANYKLASAWLRRAQLREKLLEGGVVRIPKILPDSVAQLALKTLQEMPRESWNLTQADRDASRNNVAHRFSSRRFGSETLTHLFRVLGELLPGSAVLGLQKADSWSPSRNVPDRGRYLHGDHIERHDDRQYTDVRMEDGSTVLCSRTVAVIWYLTPDWRKEWGGAFHDLETGEEILPEFNTLVAFHVPRFHAALGKTQFRDHPAMAACRSYAGEDGRAPLFVFYETLPNGSHPASQATVT